MSEHAIDRLFATILSRKGSDPEVSYTAKLLKEGVERCAKKFGEEAVETALAAVSGNSDALVCESADAIYHLLVLWAAAGIAPSDVYDALRAREGRSGVTEKASRKK
jgi:phosphoribosyl-ATP pyrophosphohydrolase